MEIGFPLARVAGPVERPHPLIKYGMLILRNVIFFIMIWDRYYIIGKDSI